jgi:hypothetical protein
MSIIEISARFHILGLVVVSGKKLSKGSGIKGNVCSLTNKDIVIDNTM